MKNTYIVILVCLVAMAQMACQKSKVGVEVNPLRSSTREIQATSLLGQPLYNPEKIPAILEQKYLEAKLAWEKDKGTADTWIWYGRRTAYLGRYREAFDIYAQALERFPDDARLYRHRGHRYINIRRFDLAVADLEQAARLINGTSDRIESDGLPNARNTPVSTEHGNVWYHLGLAHYLRNDMPQALVAYQKSMEVSRNDDMRVASGYWLYMILRRLNREDQARQVLEPIHSGMDVFENMAYHKLCLFFKGVLPEAELRKDNEGLVDYMSDALGYGLGNWYFCNGNKQKAAELWKYVIENSNWSGFARIAAEADYVRFFTVRFLK